MRRFINLLKINIIFLVFRMVAGAAEAEPVSAVQVELREVEGGGELVVTLTGNAAYKSYTLANPARVVLDLADVAWKIPKPSLSPRLPAGVTSMRYGWPKPGLTRFVLDVEKKPVIRRTAALKAGGGVQIVLSYALDGPATARPAKPAAPVAKPFRPAYTPAPIARPDRLIAEFLKPVIVIDPGHGGVDPGAISLNGTYEKHITLSYARELKKALDATGRYRVVLTRSDDRFIKLRERVAIARKVGGQLFLSLHADSTEDAAARGLSVYTLSDTASDKEAEALARSENKSDIIAGIDLSKEDEDVTGILIDLAQRETRNRSSEFADIMVSALGREVRILQNTHRFAGFAVLKAPDMPAVLIEMGFLSNREDEKQLLSQGYRSRIIRSVVQAADTYFARHPNTPWK